MMKKGRTQNILMVIAVVVLIYLLFGMNNKSAYTLSDTEYAPTPMAPTPASGEEDKKNCAMQNGVGLASSLLPREVASAEDFGEFAPEDVLAGQNFLDPRQQIGFPETVGGALRNANQQIRPDPPNPKDPYTWNNSTIVPDTMQRGLC